MGRSYEDDAFRRGVGGLQGWQDMYRPVQIPSYPEPPQDVRSYKELDQETRKEDRRDMWLSIAAALAEGGQTGQVGSALARAAQRSSDRRKESMERESHRRRSDWERQVATTDREARLTEVRQENQDREAKAKALFETWRQAQEGIDKRDRSLYRRAATLAETGDLKGLQQLLEAAPGRRSLIDKGVDPDDEMAVSLFIARAKDEAELAGKVRERGVLDPLDVEKARRTKEATLPIELREAEEREKLRRRYNPPQEAGGRQLEGRVIQREDGSYYVIDQTQKGQVLDDQGRPIKGKPTTNLKEQAMNRALQEQREHIKANEGRVVQGPPFNLQKRAEEILGELKTWYGVSQPEGKAPPAETGTKEPGGVSTAVVAQRIAMVNRNLPRLSAEEKQAATRRIVAGEPAARIVREKAFPGLPQNLWADVEDDIRSGKSIAQIQEGLRLYASSGKAQAWDGWKPRAGSFEGFADKAVEADRIRSQRALGPGATDAELRIHSRRDLDNRVGEPRPDIAQQLDAIEKVSGPLMEADRKWISQGLLRGVPIGQILWELQLSRRDWRP